MNLYAKAGVNPMASCLPMVITMVILFALIPVIYGPLTYVSNADKEELTDSNNMISNLYVVSAEVKSKDTTIEKLIEKFEKDGATEDEAYDKLEKLFTDKDKYPKSAKALSNDNKISNVMDAIKAHNDIDTFILNENYFSTNLIQSRPELMTFVFTEKEGGQYADVLPTSVKAAAEDFNYSIFGLFLGKIPTMKDLSCIIPIVSALLQLIVTFVSQHFAKKNNPDAANMGGMGMKIMLYGMPIFSLWIGFSYPAGLGLYWAASAIVRCIQQLAINKYLSTKSLDEMIAENQKKAQKKREKHGAPAKEINKMATTSTRNAGKVTKGQSGISESERDSKIQEAQARAQKAKPGSLTSKANLVSRYNQGLETAEPKVESAEKDSKKKKR